MSREPSWVGRASVGGEHPQVAAPGGLAPGLGAGRRDGSAAAGRAGLAHGVGQGEQVVARWARRRGSGASRSTSQPRGAESRSLCASQRS